MAFQAGNTGSNPVGDAVVSSSYEGKEGVRAGQVGSFSSPRPHHGRSGVPVYGLPADLADVERAKLVARLAAQSTFDPESGCRVWTGASRRAYLIRRLALEVSP